MSKRQFGLEVLSVESPWTGGINVGGIRSQETLC